MQPLLSRWENSSFMQKKALPTSQQGVLIAEKQERPTCNPTEVIAQAVEDPAAGDSW